MREVRSMGVHCMATDLYWEAARAAWRSARQSMTGAVGRANSGGGLMILMIL